MEVASKNLKPFNIEADLVYDWAEWCKWSYNQCQLVGDWGFVVVINW
jgi:hypothetical protein